MVSDHSFFVRHINTNLNKGKEQIVQEGNGYKRLFANELVFSMKDLHMTHCVCCSSQSKQTRPQRTESPASGVNNIPRLWDLRQPNCSNSQCLTGENDIWEYWLCCYGISTEQQLNKAENVQTSRHSGHWHQSHCRLTSDSHSSRKWPTLQMATTCIFTLCRPTF